jgi:hypothetical protein
LQQIVNVGSRNLREENAVYHPGVTLIEASESRPISLLCRAHQTGVFERFGSGWVRHGSASRSRHEQVNPIF